MKTIRFLLCLLPVIILAGCSGDDDDRMPERIAVQFSSDHIAGLQSRTTAGGTQWTTSDRIGIFMLKNGQTLSEEEIAEDADNVPYETRTGNSDQSGFTPAGSTIYYPQSGSSVDFIAYYPYKTTGTNAGEITHYTYPVDVSDQTRPEDIDVLYSNNATGYNKNSGPVGLQFRHVLSKVSFTLTSGKGSPNLTGAKIEISELYCTADMALTDGSLINPGSQKTITVNSSNYAMVIPQTASHSKLTITLADNKSKFEWDFPPTEFKAGKNYPYEITVDKTGITVTAGNITDWIDTGGTTTGGAGYKVGDYYPDPTNSATAIGVVFWVDPDDGRHGKVVGLEEKTGVMWGPQYEPSSADDQMNGLKNMKTVYALDNDFSDFLPFAWAHGLNNMSEDYSDPDATGIWYLPAIGELQYLLCAAAGKVPETWSGDMPSFGNWMEIDKTAFNKKLTDASGVNFGNFVYYSSSEKDGNNVWRVNFSNGDTHYGIKGNTNFRARCILAF